VGSLDVAIFVRAFHVTKHNAIDVVGAKVLSERLKQARERSGLSVNAAATALRLTRVQIWRMERPKDPETESEAISTDRLLQLARLYKVAPASLLTDDTDPALNLTTDQIGAVVQLVEEIVLTHHVRPQPEAISAAVIEILKLEQERLDDAPGGQFDPERYRGLLTTMFKNTKDVS
jgi:transcriptional regulator with XRE-family HTH domain